MRNFTQMTKHATPSQQTGIKNDHFCAKKIAKKSKLSFFGVKKGKRRMMQQSVFCDR